MIGSNKGNWGRYGLQAFGISVLGSLFLGVLSFLATLLLTEWKRHTAASHGMTQPLGMWLRNYAQKLRCSWS